MAWKNKNFTIKKTVKYTPFLVKKNNLQSGLTVGWHVANSGFDDYHAQKWSVNQF